MTVFLQLRSANSGAPFVGLNQGDTVLWDTTARAWYVGAGGGGGAVASVFGRIGVVVAATGDYDGDQVDNVSGVPGASLSDALDYLLANAGAVASVFGRVGVVVAASGDYDSDQVDNVSGVSGSSVSDALDALDADIGSLVTGVSSVFGRAGAVAAATNDYTSTQVSNASGVAGTGVTGALNTLNVSGGFVAPGAAANLGATPALNFATNRYIRGILNVDAVPTITMPAGYECWLELQQPAVGGKVVTTWPANVDWTDGLPPTLSTGNNAKDLLGFVSDGTNLRGYAIAMNVS